MELDTKLKNSERKTMRSPAGWAYRLLWVLLLISVIGAGIMTSFAAATMQVYRYNLDSDYNFGYYDDGNFIPYESAWTGEISNAAEFYEFMTFCGLSAVGLGGAAAVFLILILIFTGRLSWDESGRIYLNWYDRIWSEIHIGSVLGFGTAFSALVILLYELIPPAGLLPMFQSDSIAVQHYEMPNEVALMLIEMSMAGAAVFCLTSLVSLVKKLKAHRFWETSFVGSVILFVWRSLRRSSRTALKVMGFMVLLCIIAGYCGAQAVSNSEVWVFFGAAVCILLILLAVPAEVRKFKELRHGAAEIRSGNLTYKIPVKPDGWGTLDELNRLADDLNHIGEAQQIAVENELKNQRMKTELISNVSHDLKTPLTSMTAYIDLLKTEGLDSSNAAEYLEIIDKKTQRLKVLTENLFEAAKASSGAIPVTIGEIDLGVLVTQSLAEMEEKLCERKLTVIVRNECSTPEGCRVLADGQLLWRVVENLLGNVSKYALSGSRVYVNISKVLSHRPDEADRILLEVKNISEDALNISADELLERFKRGDESRNTEGSGLGLAIAKDLTELMHGSFNVAIDGDLFKVSVMLDEAASADRIRAATSATGVSDTMTVSVSAAMESVRETGGKIGESLNHAGHAAGNLFGTLKKKVTDRKAEPGKPDEEK